MIDNSEREKTPIGRFEILAERYIYGTEKERSIILSFMTEEEQKYFLYRVGLYHLFIDESFYKLVMASLGKQIYEEERTNNNA